MFVVTPRTVFSPAALGTGPPGRPLMGRARMVMPRELARSRIFWRTLLEYPMLRYAIVLFPIPVAMFIWPNLALPISGAPLLMFLIVLWVEGNVLSVPTPAKRRALIDRAEAERGLDLLGARMRAATARIAAGRGLATGSLTLVIEQSLMAAAPPLTLASLRGEDGAVLDLTAEEAQTIRAVLEPGPDGSLDARQLHRINLSEDNGLRAVTVDAASLSAHARLAALARARA
ncbi:MAG: hypothetical protein ACK4TB_17455 [Gemmobacter sp.]